MRRPTAVLFLAVLAGLGAACGAELSSGPRVGGAPSMTPASSPTSSPAAAPEPTTAGIALAVVEVRTAPIRAPAANCPAFETSSANLDPAMTMGGSAIRFQYQSAQPRSDGGGGWGDEVPGPVLRFKVQPAGMVEAVANRAIRLAPNASTSFADGRIEVYALGANDSIDESARPGATAYVGGDAGGLDIPVPVEAGRYLLSFRGHWLTACLEGDGFADLLLITN